MSAEHPKTTRIRRRCRTSSPSQLLLGTGNQRQLRQLAQEEQSSCALFDGGTNAAPMGPRSSHPVDIEVGRRIRFFREQAGLTQRHLGEQLGVTMQQFQKYESGANRISAARLSDVAGILGRTISEFFGGEEKTRTDHDEAQIMISRFRTMQRAELDLILHALLDIWRVAP